MYWSDGNVRVPLTVGKYGLKIGRGESESVLGTVVATVPRFHSCQSYVSESPFASVAEAVNENGVVLGMLYGPPTVGTDGGVLPVALSTSHVFPLPTWLNVVITLRLRRWKVSILLNAMS